MKIVCPHCSGHIDLVDVNRDEVVCPSCGSTMNLSGTTATATWQTKLVDQKTLGRFELVELLGRGAFGSVYRATDPELDRQVAVKVPRTGDLDGEADLDRFLREARSAAQLKHPSIVAVHEVGQIDGVPYIVSDLVQGVTLADRLSGQCLVVTDATRIVLGISRALQYAHQQGVIHRDVKPSNIILNENDQPILMDFGLAKRDVGEITMTADGDILGTPAYMSPEQAIGESHKVDGRSDVYGLGVILYEMITGELPFKGNHRMLLHQVRNEEPRAPSRLNDRIPRDLETICLKCLEKEPDRRYTTAEALGNDLERFLSNEPIEARPVGSLERSVKWVKRHPATASLAAVSGIAALAMVGMAVGLVYNSRLHRANSQIETALEAESSAKRRAEAARLAEAKQRRAAEKAGAAEAEQRMRAEKAGAAESEQRMRAEKSLLREQQLRYFNRIVLAEREWNSGNATRARALLDECPVEFRGWEWRYLYQQQKLETARLKDHTEWIWFARYSPNGETLATGSQDRTLKLYDAYSNELLKTITFPEQVLDCRFRQDSTSLLVATGMPGSKIKAGQIHIVDVIQGKIIETLENVEWYPKFKLEVNADRTTMASWSSYTELQLWSLESGNKFGDPIQREGYLLQVALSPADSVLALCYSQAPSMRIDLPCQIDIINWKSGEVLQTLSGHSQAAFGLKFSPDGKQLASSGTDRIVRIWDVTTGDQVCELHGAGGPLQYCDFDRTGRLVFGASDDGNVWMWDVQSGSQSMVFRGHERPVTGLSVHPDGRRLATSSIDLSVMVWDISTEPSLLAAESHRAPVGALAVDQVHSRIATVARDGSVKLWDIQSGLLLQSMRGHNGSVRDAKFHPDGTQLATVGQDRMIRIWDADSGRQLKMLRGHKYAITGVDVSPDGRHIVSCGGSQRGATDTHAEVYVWDTDTEKIVHELKGHTDHVWHCNFSPDGERIVTCGEDNTARIYSRKTGEQILALVGHQDNVLDAKFSPNGNVVASTSDDGTVILWDAQEGTQTRKLLGHARETMRVAFSHDGTRLATASNDTTIKLWDIATGNELITLRGHKDRLFGLSFANGDQELVSSGGDRTIRRWEIRELTDDTRIRREAAAIVNRLAERLLLKSAVRESIEAMTALSPPVRNMALELLDRHQENAALLFGAATSIIARTGHDNSAYREALQRAKRAAELHPDNNSYFNMVGMGEYRIGNHSIALEILEKTHAVYEENMGGAPWNLAFLAMAYHFSDKPEDATKTLNRLRAIMKQPRWQESTLYQAMLNEASQLIEDSTAATPPESP